MENNGYIDEEIMIIDDDAYCESLIGVSSDMRAVYDRCIMIDEFAKHHECREDEAMEFIDFNVLRALPYYGNKAPIVFDRLEDI